MQQLIEDSDIKGKVNQATNNTLRRYINDETQYKVNDYALYSTNQPP